PGRRHRSGECPGRSVRPLPPAAARQRGERRHYCHRAVVRRRQHQRGGSCLWVHEITYQGANMYTEQITQSMAIGPAVPPQVINNTNKTAGGVDMSVSRRAIFILEIGAVAGGGSINAQLVDDTQASLATATNLAGSNTSLTGLTVA